MYQHFVYGLIFLNNSSSIRYFGANSAYYAQVCQSNTAKINVTEFLEMKQSTK